MRSARSTTEIRVDLNDTCELSTLYLLPAEKSKTPRTLATRETSIFLGAIITFRVSRRRREMYTGHVRLSVCPCVCPSPHANTTARTRM